MTEGPMNGVWNTWEYEVPGLINSPHADTLPNGYRIADVTRDAHGRYLTKVDGEALLPGFDALLAPERPPVRDTIPHHVVATAVLIGAAFGYVAAVVGMTLLGVI